MRPGSGGAPRCSERGPGPGRPEERAWGGGACAWLVEAWSRAAGPRPVPRRERAPPVRGCCGFCPRRGADPAGFRGPCFLPVTRRHGELQVRPSISGPPTRCRRVGKASGRIWLPSKAGGPRRLGSGGCWRRSQPLAHGSPGPALPRGSDSSWAEDSWPYKAVCGHLLEKRQSPHPRLPPMGTRAWPGPQGWRGEGAGRSPVLRGRRAGAGPVLGWGSGPPGATLPSVPLTCSPGAAPSALWREVVRMGWRSTGAKGQIG